MVLMGLNVAMIIVAIGQLGYVFKIRLSVPGKICSGDFIPSNAKYFEEYQDYKDYYLFQEGRFL